MEEIILNTTPETETESEAIEIEIEENNFKLSKEYIEQQSTIFCLEPIQELDTKGTNIIELNYEQIIRRIQHSKWRTTINPKNKSVYLSNKLFDQGIKLYYAIKSNENLFQHFLNQDYYNEQVLFVTKIIPEHFSLDSVGVLFGIKRNGVDSIIKIKSRNFVANKSGRKTIINNNTIVSIKNFIEQEEKNNTGLTMSDIIHKIEEIQHVTPSYSTAYKIIKSLGYKFHRINLEDVDRVTVSIQDILNKYKEFNEKYSAKVNNKLLFSMDEVGDFGLDKSSNRFVIIRKDIDTDTLQIGNVSQKTTTTTIISSIAANGTRGPTGIVMNTPFFFSEINNSFDNFTCYCTHNGFSNQMIFDLWFAYQFVPFVVKTRLENNLDVSDVCVLMLDNCSCHSDTNIKPLCTTYNIELFYIAAHSTHYTQALDVSLFGNFKSKLTKFRHLYKIQFDPKYNSEHGIPFFPRLVHDFQKSVQYLGKSQKNYFFTIKNYKLKPNVSRKNT